MAMKLYSDASVQAIANAIRTKNGASTQYKIADMAPAILAIPTGGGGGNADVSQDASGYIVVDESAPSDSGSTTIQVSIPSAQWQNKGVTSATGGMGENTNRLVPATCISGAVKISAPTGYNIALFIWKNTVGAYTVENTYQGGWTGSEIVKSLTWHTTIDTSDIPSWWEYCFVPVVKTSSDTAISPSEGENITFKFYCGVNNV